MEKAEFTHEAMVPYLKKMTEYFTKRTGYIVVMAKDDKLVSLDCFHEEYAFCEGELREYIIFEEIKNLEDPFTIFPKRKFAEKFKETLEMLFVDFSFRLFECNYVLHHFKKKSIVPGYGGPTAFCNFIKAAYHRTLIAESVELTQWIRKEEDEIEE